MAVDLTHKLLLTDRCSHRSAAFTHRQATHSTRSLPSRSNLRCRNNDVVDDLIVPTTSPPTPPPIPSQITQISTTLVLYALHLCILTKRSFVFPFQLIPNNHGLFLQIGYDSIAGMLSLAMFLRYNHNKRLKTDSNHDQNESSESPLPWHVPQKLKPKVTTVALILLTLYFASGLFAQTYDQILFALKTFGLPITDQMHMSLQVLLSHLTWVFMGVNILGTQLPDFFKRESTWYKARVGSNWMWWVCGGYFFSSWVFNCADCFNQLILPGSLFAVDEGVGEIEERSDENAIQV